MKTYAIFNDSFFKNKPWWMPYKLYKVVWQRSNPRSKEYMLNLLQKQFPEAELINANGSDVNDQLVLLYPDAIGIGCGKLERVILKRFNKIKILNGRKRCFEINKKVLFMLRVKRFLEMTFLPEIVMAPFLLTYGVALVIKDKIVRFS